MRLQTTSQYKGALDGATQILKTEGASAFYKGTLTPLIGIGACVSVQFGAFNYARRAFEARNASQQHKSVQDIASQPQPLAYWQYYAAGAFAGISNTVLSSPIEHIRIRLQTQPHGAGRLYKGPLDCIAKLSRSPSVAKGLYRGTSVTFMREAQAYGFWFLSFEYMMQSDAKRNSVARKSTSASASVPGGTWDFKTDNLHTGKDIPTWKIATYGGLAGEFLWISSYPFDVVKSKMQTDGFGDKQRYKSMRDAFAQTYKQEGMLGFWRGVGPTLLRAMPVSAGTFAVVEVTMRLIS